MGKAARAAGLQRRENERVAAVAAEAARAVRKAAYEAAMEQEPPAAPVTVPARKQPVQRVAVEAGYPEDWRARLGASRDRERKERQRQDLIVAQAVAAGATWSAVAKQLGTSRQYAWKRFRHVVGQVESGS